MEFLGFSSVRGTVWPQTRVAAPAKVSVRLGPKAANGADEWRFGRFADGCGSAFKSLDAFEPPRRKLVKLISFQPLEPRGQGG